MSNISNVPPIILASGSEIRAQILRGAGIDFTVKTKPVDEASIKEAMLAENSRLRDIADALAEAKSMRVSRETPGFVIGADQIMVMDGKLFDKPKDMTEARERLKDMRGKTHNLLGAIVICENGIPVWRHIAKTTLKMRDFSDSFLDNYLEAEGDVVLKSVGAYRFEGRGAQLFSHVDGDFFSILGLSLLPVLDYLRSRGAVEI
ncbi:MAG: Maf family protein [Maricaulaceae bacterium]